MPEDTQNNIVTFNILINGKPIPDSIQIFSVNVDRKVNRIASACLEIMDGSASEQSFEISSSDVFVPGNKIDILAGYDNVNETIFKGIITKHCIRINDMGSSLKIECRDEAVKMTVGINNKSFSGQSDSDIISAIISNYSGLSSNIAPTSIVIPQQIQYNVTDWDFIMTLAENNGYIVTTVDNTISAFKPDAYSQPVSKITYGENLLEFNADINAVSQLANVKASSWDYKTQSVISEQKTNNYSGPGNLSSKKLSEVVGLNDYNLTTPVPLNNESLKNWCNAQIVKSNYAKIRGNAKFQGSHLPNIANYITFAGLGERFNGDYLVSGVEHFIEDGNWITSVELGLSDEWFASQVNIAAPKASGLIPGISGLTTAIIVQNDNDPENENRVLVDISSNGNQLRVWARMSNFYATKMAGSYFYPEVSDEVILGFINEDPRFPVILGSLYSSMIPPNPSSTANTSVKSFVSKSGISASFNDDTKVYTVSTPGRNSVTLSDNEKLVSLSDQNGNSIVLSEDGITIKSTKDIKLTANQLIGINAETGINTEATGGDINIKGMNINETAEMMYNARGNQMAKVTGGMELTLKGAMVMIN